MVMNSAGVTSYIGFSSCKFGRSCQALSAVAALPWMSNSSGGATSLVTMESRATLSVNFMLSQQTMTGTSASLAIIATIAEPVMCLSLDIIYFVDNL